MNNNVTPITNPPAHLNYRAIGIVIALICTLIGTIYKTMDKRLDAASSQAMTNKEDIRNLSTVVKLRVEGMDKALHDIKTNQSLNHISTNERLNDLTELIISYNKNGNRIGHTQ